MSTTHHTPFGHVELPDGGYLELDQRIDRRPARPVRGEGRRIRATLAAVAA